MLYSGIDLHKRTTVITTLDEAGNVRAQASLANSQRDIVRYFTELPEPSVAVVDATSCWYWLRDLLDYHDVRVRSPTVTSDQAPRGSALVDPRHDPGARNSVV